MKDTLETCAKCYRNIEGDKVIKIRVCHRWAQVTKAWGKKTLWRERMSDQENGQGSIEGRAEWEEI